jgi:hypothetical protein
MRHPQLDRRLEWTSDGNGPFVDGNRLGACPREAVENEAFRVAELVENHRNHDRVVYQFTRFESTHDPSPERGPA